MLSQTGCVWDQVDTQGNRPEILIMEIVFYILFSLPLALWAFGGFKIHELVRETPKLIGWYVVVGAAYLIFM